MGIDITHVVKNDFFKVEDKEASMQYAMDTINVLKSNLHLDDDIESFYLYHDDEYNETIFRLPLYDVEFTLHNGFWQIESYYHYCQIVMHQGENFWLREMIFDIAQALGHNEMWHAQEYYTWNGGPMELSECSFTEWMDFIMKKFNGRIPEYDYKGIMAQGAIHIPDYEPIYHDSFEECIEKRCRLTEKFAIAGFEPIGLMDIGGRIRCRKLSDNSIHLVDIETLKPLTNFSPDAYYFDYPSTIFVIRKSGKYALFDVCEWKQITEFVSEPFKKEWSKEDNDFIIINVEAGIRQIFPWK